MLLTTSGPGEPFLCQPIGIAIYLLTETAKPYFEKRSYTIVERDNTPDVIRRSSEFSHVCPVTAVVMKKTLDK